MSSEEPAIRVTDITKCYELYATPKDRFKQILMPSFAKLAEKVFRSPPLTTQANSPRFFKEVWALRNISFQVMPGETMGIIGRNGSGKSTLLQIISGTLAPTSGEVSVIGRTAALLELGSGFNPEYSGRDNIFHNGLILGLSKKEVQNKYDEIVSFADIGEFINHPVKTYSSGMFVRLAFAVQSHIDASVIIIDEALAVGDVFFRQKCYKRLEHLRDSGAAILLVSHSMPEIEQFCEKAILLENGSQSFIGSSTEATKRYYLLNQGSTTISLQDSTQETPDDSRSSDAHAPPPFRPPPEAFIDISRKTQVNNGKAVCVGVALTNEAGEPCSSFQQGDKAVFYFEFNLNEDIGVPVCGIVISNERGVIVYGKNSWQANLDTEKQYPVGKAGTNVSCRQEVVLDLGIGEYVVEVGLTATSVEIWAKRMKLSHMESESLQARICHMTSALSFSVNFLQQNGVPMLTHHGVANLPGSIEVSCTKRIDKGIKNSLAAV